MRALDVADCKDERKCAAYAGETTCASRRKRRPAIARKALHTDGRVTRRSRRSVLERERDHTSSRIL